MHRPMSKKTAAGKSAVRSHIALLSIHSRRKLHTYKPGQYASICHATNPSQHRCCMHACLPACLPLLIDRKEPRHVANASSSRWSPVFYVSECHRLGKPLGAHAGNDAAFTRSHHARDVARFSFCVGWDGGCNLLFVVLLTRGEVGC